MLLFLVFFEFFKGVFGAWISRKNEKFFSVYVIKVKLQQVKLAEFIQNIIKKT
jgi:hypothetical protein